MCVLILVYVSACYYTGVVHSGKAPEAETAEQLRLLQLEMLLSEVWLSLSRARALCLSLCLSLSLSLAPEAETAALLRVKAARATA
jgi:hypothetical protein